MTALSEETFKALLVDVNRIEEVATGAISLWLTQHAEGIQIEAIWSEKERRVGHASSAMRTLFKIADQYGADIFGQVHVLTYDTETHERSGLFSADQIDLMDRLNTEQLEADELLSWYQRLGFELTGEMHWDDPEIVRRAVAPLPVP